MTPKITEKEWRQFVEVQMANKGFSRRERDVVKSAFYGNLRDVDYGEEKPFLSAFRPGITAAELHDTLALLKNRHSPLAKGLGVHIDPEKIDVLTEILSTALEENRERWF